MQVTFIVNSKIKKRHRTLNEIGDVFYKDEHIQTTILQSQYAGHSVELATECTKNGSDYLIAVGGDGTLNEVLNGMLNASVPINNYPILGVLPKGSANDFVRTIIPLQNLPQLKKAILNKSARKIDIGKVVLGSTPLRPKYFINIAGLGLGPEVVKIMQGSNKLFGSKASYFSAIIKGFLSYDKRAVKCECEEWSWEGSLLQMAVANGRYFGDGICIAPDASVADGLLHVTLFGELSLMDYLLNLGKLKKGIKINLEGAHYFTTKQLKISSTAIKPSGIETDGEYVGEAPATITVVPNAIKFISP
jgi:YegS/Rv2252/BmrU family lipid kinase